MMFVFGSLLCWMLLFMYSRRHPVHGPYGERGGGGDTQVVQAPTPAPAPSTAEAIEAYISGMPRMYEAQLEWAPQLAAQQMGLTAQYVPQIAALSQQLQQQYSPALAQQQWALQQQYAPLYATQQQEIQQQFEPEAYAARAALGGITSGEYMTTAPWMQAGTPGSQALASIYAPEYLTGYSAQEAPGMEAARQRVIQGARDAWSVRGLAESGMSAEDEMRRLAEFEFPYALGQEQLTQQTLAGRQAAALGAAGMEMGAQESAYDRYLQEIARRQNVGLSLAGRYNVATQPQVAAPQVSTPTYIAPNVMQGFDLGNVMNFMSQGYSTQTAASRPLGYTTSGGGLFGGLFG